MSTLKDRLEAAVKKKGITISQARAELRRLTGMTRSNMTHWFTGRTKVPSAQATLIAAEYLDVDPRWLAEGRGTLEVAGAKRKARTMTVPQGLMPEELATLIALASAMDAETRTAWRKI